MVRASGFLRFIKHEFANEQDTLIVKQSSSAFQTSNSAGRFGSTSSQQPILKLSSEEKARNKLIITINRILIAGQSHTLLKDMQ